MSAFNEKMNAAFFFYNKLCDIWVPGTRINEVPNEIYYYSDAVVFELHAASQQLLQLINLKAQLDLPTHNAAWNAKFKRLLQEARPDLYEWWSKVSVTSEMCVLEGYRQHISHRGSSHLIFAHEGERGPVIAISIPVRWRSVSGVTVKASGGQSIELFDELKRIADELNQFYETLKKM
jgi:hypothetical protein